MFPVHILFHKKWLLEFFFIHAILADEWPTTLPPRAAKAYGIVAIKTRIGTCVTGVMGAIVAPIKTLADRTFHLVAVVTCRSASRAAITLAPKAFYRTVLCALPRAVEQTGLFDRYCPYVIADTQHCCNPIA